jgi:hypothetical protein
MSRTAASTSLSGLRWEPGAEAFAMRTSTAIVGSARMPCALMISMYVGSVTSPSVKT